MLEQTPSRWDDNILFDTSVVVSRNKEPEGRKRREGTWHISVVFSSTSVSQEGRSHELYIRERENDRHD